MSNLLVTIFSDASVRENAVGCGFWFKSGSATGKGSESMQSERVINSNEAELWGILHAIKAAKLAHDGTIDLVVQCDNISALAAMVNHGGRFAKSSKLKAGCRKRLTPFENSCLSKIRNIEGIGKIWLKHVKGHSSGCSRTFVNGITDRLAGRASLIPIHTGKSDDHAKAYLGEEPKIGVETFKPWLP